MGFEIMGHVFWFEKLLQEKIERFTSTSDNPKYQKEQYSELPVANSKRRNTREKSVDAEYQNIFPDKATHQKCPMIGKIYRVFIFSDVSKRSDDKYTKDTNKCQTDISEHTKTG